MMDLSDMTIAELQALRAQIDMRLHFLVLGDPRECFSFGAKELERSAGPQESIESK